MKQTKQFIRPLLMAIVMLVGMLVPQGAWAQMYLFTQWGDEFRCESMDEALRTLTDLREKGNIVTTMRFEQDNAISEELDLSRLGQDITIDLNGCVLTNERDPGHSMSCIVAFSGCDYRITIQNGTIESYELDAIYFRGKSSDNNSQLILENVNVVTHQEGRHCLFDAKPEDIEEWGYENPERAPYLQIINSEFHSNGCSAISFTLQRNDEYVKSILPDGYSFYNANTGVELVEYADRPFVDEKGNPATDIRTGFITSWTWADDHSSATLRINHEDVDAVVTNEDTTPATCVASGVRTYTAAATYRDRNYADTKDEEIAIDPDAHNYIGGVCQNCGESETQGPIIMTYLSGTSGIGFGEGAASLIDGDDDTKWCSNWYADNKPYIIFKTNVPAKLTGYNMVHGNDTPDYPGRAWATWTIYGANFDSDSQATAESTAWKEVDKHSGYSFVDSDYSFSNLTSLQYQYYKIVVDEVPNNSLQQMAEIHFTFFACNHKGTFTEHPATEATAEAHGNAAAYKMCDICGACLDADGQEIAASVIHYFDEEHTHAAQDPSCTQVGNIAYKECAVCQAIFDLDGNPIDSYELPMSDHSYDSEGKCITCDQKLPLLSLGSNTIDIEEGYTIFYFIAPQDATYIFETVGDEDTYGAILSTDGETIIAEDDDCGNGQNFRLSYEMSAGSIVTLRVTQYAYKAIPGYTLVIREHNHEWRDGVCAECHKICDHSDMEDLGHSDATCTQPAGTSRKCNICSFTEFTPDPESSALGHNVVDGVCTRCEKSMAVAVTIGSDTHQFIDFEEALPVALDALSATVTLLTDVTLPEDKELFFDRGNITLDLNGKKISGNGIRIVYLLGGNLTITDNTADKKGVIENTTNGGDGISSAVVWVDLGALVIHAGTFCSKSELALYANQHNQEFINVTIDGGRFVSLEGGAAISTVYKSSLAEGYAYYKTGTCEEIEEQLDTPISEYDIIVLPMSIKAHDFTSKTLTAEPDEHGLYAYVCDHGCGAHGDYNVVKDGEAFHNSVEFTTSNVTMAREFTQSVGDAVVPATIMLPFSIEADKLATETADGVTGTKFYAFTSLTQNAETGKWEANMDRVTGTVEAYTPYMIVLTEGTTIDLGSNEVTFPATPDTFNNTKRGDWTFVATNEEKVWKEDDFANGEVYYGFAAGNETTPEGKFVKVGAGASIDPLRAYIMKTPQTRAAGTLPSIISVRLNETSATGIGTLNTETGEFTFDGWYDLQGLPVGGSYRGIVIQDGKKFIMQ